MRPQTLARAAVPLLALAIAAGWVAAGPARAQTGEKPGADAPRGPHAADEAAVREADAAFVRAYNKGDAEALAALFTDDAEVIEADGARYQGRDLIARSFTETFAAGKGARIALEVASVRFLTPDVAREEGRSVVTPPQGQGQGQGPPVRRFYTVLFVRRDGRWLLANVREDPDPVVRPRERLRELEWMVGDWLDEGSDHVVKASCRWSPDGNYLLRDFQVYRGGKSVMSVTQRVGWDPLAGEFRSWQFDSEGGFGEGRWARDGDRWVVKESGVRPDGTTASSTRITLKEGPDRVRWTLLDRVAGGEAVPGEETSVLTRVPPRLGASAAPANPDHVPPTPRPERSPR